MAACGGGGGGGGGGGSSDTPLQYTGNTSAAAITNTNASTLAGNVMGGGDVAAATAAISGGSETSVGQGQVDVGRRLIHTFRATLTQRSDSASRPISVLVDQTESCTNGGTVRIVGDVTPSGTGTVNVTYTNCTEDVDSLSGSASMRIDNAANILGDIVFTDYTISFTRLRIRGSVNADISGSVRVLADIPTNRETATENIVTLNNVTGRMTKSENLVFEDTYDDLSNPSTYTELVSGRVFDSMHGFVDITTSIELRFPFLTQPFPSGGELVLTGAGNARIRVTANSLTMVTLGLDLDGNGVFERQARLAWTNLQPNSIAADLGDNDGDGMHNSWETAFGLNPNLPDAALDSDGDGFSNFVEYQGGGHPVNGGITPVLTVGAAFPAASNIAVANSNMDIPGPSAIAFDGVNYLLVSCREVGPSPGVFGVLISPSGGVLSNFLIVSDTCPRNTAVAFDGTNYLVVRTANGGDVLGHRVTPAGGVLDGSGFLISSPSGGTVNHRPAVAFNGTNYLAVWVNTVGGGRIFGAIVAPDGTAGSAFAVSSGGTFETSPMLAFDGTNYLVVWTGGSSGSEDVSGAFVSPSGVAAAPFGIATLANSQFAGGVAFDGANYLVVWDHTANTSFFPPPDGQIFGRRVAPNGTLLDGSAGSAGIPISTGAFANHSSSVAFTGSSYLVTWAVGAFPNSPPAGIYAVRVSTGGVRLDGPPGDLGFAVGGAPTTFARFVHPVAVAGGQNALIAWVNNIELSGTEKDILAAPVFGP